MKTKFLFIISTIIILFGIKNTNAQSIAALQYNRVRPLLSHQLAEDLKIDGVDGSPLLTAGWAKGVVKLTDGRTYGDILLNYNEMTDELLFKDTKGNTLNFINPVNEFKMTLADGREKIFLNGFKNIPNTTETSFFEVLADGTASLIKRYSKSVVESKEYNSPAIKTFEENTKYYLIVAGQAVPVKKDKKTILTALGNKQPELETYIKTNNLNFTSDEDLGKLITFYNSL